MKYKLEPVPGRTGKFQLVCVTEFANPHGRVFAGELGGIVSSEKCVSQEDNSWICQGSVADEESVLGPDCWVKGSSGLVNAQLVRGVFVKESRVENTKAERSRMTESRVFGSNLIGGMILRSTVHASDILQSSVVSGGSVQSSRLKESEVDHAVVLSCDLQETICFSTHTEDSIWVKARCPMLFPAFKHYKASVVGPNRMAVGCQIYTFDEWLNHDHAVDVMLDASSEEENDGDWEQFQVAVNAMRHMHDRLVENGSLKARTELLNTGFNG